MKAKNMIGNEDEPIMRTSFIIFAVLMCLSWDARAVITNDIVLTGEYTIGHADSGYRKTCTIKESQVRTLVTGINGENPKNVYAPLTFTEAIPNISIARKLILDASLGKLKTTAAQTEDSPYVQYHGYVFGRIKSIQVLLRSSAKTIDENLSPMTLPLLKFVETNCGF
jgi:hypothetical protein